jgi:hypothetical protein
MARGPGTKVVILCWLSDRFFCASRDARRALSFVAIIARLENSPERITGHYGREECNANGRRPARGHTLELQVTHDLGPEQNVRGPESLARA